LKPAYKADKTLSFSSGNRTKEAPVNAGASFLFKLKHIILKINSDIK